MDGPDIAALYFSQLDTIYGPVSVLSSIDIMAYEANTGGTLLTTTYQYEELLCSKTYNDIYFPTSNSMIAMTQINYPTGAYSKYSYKTYKETTYAGYLPGSNETYKISSRIDMIDGEESGRKDYDYINNSSGYPFSFRLTDPEKNGRIAGEIRYHTLVTEPVSGSENQKKTTLYTFDNTHQKINEEVYLEALIIIKKLSLYRVQEMTANLRLHIMECITLSIAYI